MQQKLTKALVILASAGLLALYQHFQPPTDAGGRAKPAPTTASQTRNNQQTAASGPQAVARIRSSATNPDAKFWTTVSGEVVKLFKDDREGSEHQRFLLKIAPDITLLVAHNIDLAEQIPVQEGGRLTVSGEYVWNNRGGVMHWTHHDPKGHRGGWIEYNNKRYK